MKKSAKPVSESASSQEPSQFLPHLRLLLEFKYCILKNSFVRMRKKSPAELATVIVFFVGAGAALFAFFHYSFRFFRSQEPFGPLLIDETFYLFGFALFFMLLVSTSVSAYASLFQSKEIPFLITRSVNWEEAYFIKFTESLWYSSWAFLFLIVPFMAAYGINKNAEVILFPILCLAFYIPLALLAGLIGTLAAMLMVWLLPDKKRRRVAFLGALIAIIYYFAHTTPALIKEQGSIAGIMGGYLPHVAFAKNPLLPSYWAVHGIMALSRLKTQELLQWQDGIFYFLILISNTLFFLIPSYSIAKRLYPKIYLKTQDYAEIWSPRRIRFSRFFEKWIDLIPYPPKPVMAFLEKDLKTFARDPAEWSQQIILFGLLLLYFANLKNLEFTYLQSFWKQIVFGLNTVGAFIVLSSFNMRFLFPMLSLEGSRFWIIDLSPIRMSALLLEKFMLGIVMSAFLIIPLVFLSGSMLEIPMKNILFTTGLGFFVCIALTGLSVGLGATFPNFNSTNPAEIISGLGGSLLLAAHLTYLAIIGIFLLAAKDPHWIVFLSVAAGSLLVGALPLRMGLKALQKHEF